MLSPLLRLKKSAANAQMLANAPPGNGRSAGDPCQRKEGGPFTIWSDKLAALWRMCNMPPRNAGDGPATGFRTWLIRHRP